MYSLTDLNFRSPKMKVLAGLHLLPDTAGEIVSSHFLLSRYHLCTSALDLILHLQNELWDLPVFLFTQVKIQQILF